MIKALALGLLLLTGSALAADAPQPALYFSAHSCGGIVVWIIFDDGSVKRFDADHMPPNLAEFKDILKTIPGDIVELPCKEAK